MRSRRALAIALVLVVALGTGCATMSLAESIESLLRQIKELIGARRWDEALTKVAEVIRRDPAQWQAYLYGAQAYIGKADWRQALTSARKALDLAPREPEALTTLAESLFGAGSDALQRRAYADAAGHFVEYVKLKPSDVRGYLNGGRAYLGQERWADAGRVLVEGLGHAADPAARTQIAQSLLEGGRQALARDQYRGAATLLGEYVRQDPHNVSALVDLAKAYWGGGERGAALDTFRQVLELSPGNAEARRFLFGQ